MTEVVSNPSTPLTQALAPLSLQEILDDLAQSPQCVELDRTNSAAPPVPPAISTGDAYVGDGWPAEFSPFDPASAPPEFGRRLILIMRRADRASRAAKMKASRRAKAKRQPTAGRSITPGRQRVARARAVHSHAAHGGARKSGDGGDGGGDPPATAPTRIYFRPGGRVFIEQDEVGPNGEWTGYALGVEFPTIGKAVENLLGFEEWARANGTWVGPSYLDPQHPAYAFIRQGLH
jgi:hypothetical protein